MVLTLVLILLVIKFKKFPFPVDISTNSKFLIFFEIVNLLIFSIIENDCSA